MIVITLQLVFRPEGCWGGYRAEGGGLLPVLSVLLFGLTLRHLEDHLHVVGPAPPAGPPVDVLVGGGGDEVVLLPWGELQGPGGGGEGPEGDGEVHEAPGSVADRHDPRCGAADSAGLELLLVHTVDHVLLLLLPLPHHWADQVDLVVLPGQVPLVDHDGDGAVCEAGRGGVPVDIPNRGGSCGEQQSLEDDDLHLVSLWHLTTSPQESQAVTDGWNVARLSGAGRGEGGVGVRRGRGQVGPSSPHLTSTRRLRVSSGVRYEPGRAVFPGQGNIFTGNHLVFG